MHVTIIIPPYVVNGLRAVIPSKAMLPVGALSVAATLQSNHDVEVLDLVFCEDFLQELFCLRAPEVILIACHTARNLQSVKMIVRFLRERLALRESVPIYVGGPLTTELGTADFHRLGIPVTGVFRGYTQGFTAEYWPGQPGDLVGVAEPHLALPALDLLPERTRALYRVKSGGNYPLVGHGFGCRWSCRYCTAKMGSAWMERPLEQVAVEMSQATHHGYSHLWCVDNLLLTNPRRTAAFDRLVQRAGLTWSGMTRSELVIQDGQTLRDYRALTSIALGVESASAAQLAHYHRGQRVSPVDAFQLLAQERPDIERVAFAILDWPESTDHDFWQLVKLLKACQSTTVSWSFYNPPVRDLMEGRGPEGYGFYRWPLGCSRLPPRRIVQQAMLLSGRWWRGWQPDYAKPFFANQCGFGVRFAEGNLYQPHKARSPIGDIWEVWQERS